MNYLALYRKYRPTIFDEVIGQHYVVEVLKNSIEKGFVSHAYLFSGPRGTGKTTLAKILAKTINCESLSNCNCCDKCSSCESFNNKTNPDIIEMDAASNNGVDDIRKIRDAVNLMPNISKHKVYIIDEVHMLSPGAFNALLKTLEEPPEHVIFILATTEYYKIPETIVSRCQCFNFEQISINDIVNKLSYIVKKENISIDHEVLNLIAKYSDGGLRDAINMLDKLVSYSKDITIDDYYKLKGIVSDDVLKLLFNNIYSNDVVNMLDVINELVNSGKDLVVLLESLMCYVKELLINSYQNHDCEIDSNYLYDIVVMLNELDLVLVKTKNKRIMFETGIIRMMQVLTKKYNINCINKTNVCNNVENSVNDDDKLKNALIVDKNDDIIHEDVVMIDKDVNNKDIRINNALALANKKVLSDLKIRWIDFSNYVGDDEFSSLVSYLIDSTIRVAGEKDLILSVKYDSVLKNIDLNFNKIEEVFNKIMKSNYKLVFISDSDWNKIRSEYVNNIKKDKNFYSYIDEPEITCSFDNVSNNDLSDTVVDALSLFGKDVVELK